MSAKLPTDTNSDLWIPLHSCGKLMQGNNGSGEGKGHLQTNRIRGKSNKPQEGLGGKKPAPGEEARTCWAQTPLICAARACDAHPRGPGEGLAHSRRAWTCQGWVCITLRQCLDTCPRAFLPLRRPDDSYTCLPKLFPNRTAGAPKPPACRVPEAVVWV